VTNHVFPRVAVETISDTLVPIRHLLIVTDAWHPQVNGVVRTLDMLARQLEARGVRVDMLTPDAFTTLPLPLYPEIRLAAVAPSTIGAILERIDAGHVHIATEGPLGLMARHHCLRERRSFTTSYHTRFPEYLRSRLPVPESWSYRWLRRFHNAGGGTLVATPSLAGELAGRGFTKTRIWSRGVDTDLFTPQRRTDLGLARPVFLSVGRVAVEKNLPAFLELDLPGTKVVVGAGPSLPTLRRRYPDAMFLGRRTGAELADIYASADVFVFPSRTDTFGIVLLEAMASGLPVAAFPVTGPMDVLLDGVGGVVSEDLRQAALAALSVSRAAARARALTHSWGSCADLFLKHVAAAHGDRFANPAG
jgi:glycosyltransferase involved in cell wall biosynthesis